MKDLSLAFALYNQTITNGFKQLHRDLSALNKAVDHIIASDRTDQAVQEKPCTEECTCCCFECGGEVQDAGVPRRCSSC